MAQSTVFVVRHADREAPEPDPPLTALGLKQASALARVLASANITHIFTSEAIRSHQTAAPTADSFHVKSVVIDSAKLDELIAQVRATLKPGEATLVVGHRGSVPKIVKTLTGRDVAPLAVGEFDRLEVVTVLPGGSSNVVTLHYPVDCVPAASGK